MMVGNKLPNMNSVMALHFTNLAYIHPALKQWPYEGTLI